MAHAGHDAGKKVKGRKRHAMVDTDGRLPVLQVGPASAQDRDGAVPLLQSSRRGFPFVERAFRRQRLRREPRCPIEPVWAKVKARPRRVAARTADALHEALGPALASVTAQDAAGLFRHCGYNRPK